MHDPESARTLAIRFCLPAAHDGQHSCTAFEAGFRQYVSFDRAGIVSTIPTSEHGIRARESAQVELDNARYLAARFTEAVAWLHTLKHFDHDLPTIANYLSISGGALRLRRQKR